MVFVIAECGVNWRDLVDADQMIKAAAEAGADACKFQAYDTVFTDIDHPKLHLINPDYESELLKIDPTYSATKNKPYHERAEELNAIRLNESTIRYLYWRCQQHGIEFMCTPFYPEAVAMLDPYVKRWKVRCADNKNMEIISACYLTGKDILISSETPLPTHDFKDISEESHIKNLFCVPEYPPSFTSKTAGHIQDFDGYSCHIPVVLGAETSARGGKIKYLEVHVRLDHYEPPHYCPIDTAVSITMSELAELCRRLKT